MKKLFLFMILLALPLVAGAYDCQVDGIFYDLIPKGNVAEVTFKSFDFNSYSGSVTIPEKFTYDGVNYCVTGIVGQAFYGCSSLTSVTIPNSVTSIGDYAFYGCSGLTSVTIPNSMTSIGNRVFQNCSSLTSVTIPNSVTNIGIETFSNCSGLTSATIPNSVTNIGRDAFNGCYSLTSVHITDLESWCKILFSNSSSNPLANAQHLYLNGKEIKDLVFPSSLNSIGNYTFQGCSGLTSVTIPNTVTSIGYGAFSACLELTSVTIPNSVNNIGRDAFSYCYSLNSVTISNSVTSIESGTFLFCTGLTSVIIPNSVTSIGQNAFYGCSGLTSVIIPNSVTRIGEWVFAECSKLEEVYSLAENVPSTSTNAFEKSYPEYIKLYVPASALNAYTTTVPWSEFGIILPLPDETGIENVKKQKTEITDRYIPDGKRVDTPKKGLNIIRMSDGTVKKVVVK